MSKVVKAVVGVALAVAGIVTGNFLLVSVGLSLAGSSILAPKLPRVDRAAAAETLQLGEVARQAVFGKAAVAGSLVDAFNYGGKNGTDWEVLVIALADHRCDALEGMFVNDTFVAFAADGAVAGFNAQLEVYWRPGTAAQTVPAILTTHGPGWTANDRGKGVAHVVVAYKIDAADAKNPVWPGGRPRFRWVVRGLRCYDPRKDDTAGGAGAHRYADPATWQWSENPIVCRYNWVRGIFAMDLTAQPEMLLVGRGLSEVEAPAANVFSRANLCDEIVSGEARYRVGGLIAASEAYIDIESEIAAACAGVIVQPEGAVEIDPGEARAPVASFTDDDLIVGSEAKWSDFLGDSDEGWINTAIALFTDPAQAWKERSAPPRRDLADIAADGSPREAQLRLLLVNWMNQAQRVAEIARRYGRLWGRGQVTLPPRFAAIEEGDWVTWQSARRFGGATLTFRVEGWESGQDWHHRLTLRQISSSVFSDTAPLSDGAIAAQQVAPGDVPAPDPGSWALAIGTSGPDEIPVLVVTGATDDPDAQLVRMEYFEGAAPPGPGENWTDAGVVGPDTVRREIPIILAGTYYVAVSYVVGGVTGARLILGPVSPSVELSGKTTTFTSGKVSAPASLTLDFRNRLLSTPISYTRAGTATRTNEQGLIEAVAADVTRYDYDPVSRALLGLLIEPAATNLVVNSLLDGSNLATQSVTVTAVPHVISFYGSGSITLSGAHVAVVNGTGAYPARTTLVFTPTAGSLTLTVSGTVQFAQLETGTFATSFIPTAASAVTRNADDASITGTDFSDFFNASEGTIFVEGAIPPAADGANGNYYLSLNNGTLNERIDILDTNGSRVIVSDGGVTQASIQKTPEPAGSVRLALAFKVNDLAFVENGGAVSPDTTATLPTVDRLTIGARGAVAAGTQAGGHISSIRFYPKRLTDTELPALTGFPTAASTGDLFIDENDNNTVYQFDGTGWIKVVSAVASQITDQAPAATDGTIEGSADVTKAIQGTALIEVAYDFAGVVKSAQFPINKSYKLVTSGGVEITSGVTWGVSTTSGGWSGTAPSITGTGAGALAINSGPNVSTAQVRVTATLNGRQYTFTADVKQKLDDPPVSGGSSGTTASEQFVKSVSTAWVDATGELVANTGAGITNFDLTAANLAISSNDLTPPVNGSSNVQGQWLWWDGGAWQVVGTVSDSSPDVTFTASEESPGSLTVNKQKTGLSGATQYKFKLQLKISSGTVDPVIVSGTASIEGGT